MLKGMIRVGNTAIEVNNKEQLAKLAEVFKGKTVAEVVTMVYNYNWCKSA